MSKLQYKECITIEILLKEWYKANKIAEKLNINKSSLSRHIKKYNTNWVYNATIAWTKKQLVKTLANQSNPRIEKWSELEKYILEKIKEYRSPEQIVWRLKYEKWELISKDTIYKYIYNYYPELIKKYLRRGWKKYISQTQKKAMLWDRKFIDKRPQIVNLRERMGDREWDSIEDLTHKFRILTQVDRMSRYLLAGLCSSKNAINVINTMHEMFHGIMPEKRITMTLDNWIEFKDFNTIWVVTWTDVYFAYPHSPRQRWTNENTNWLLRQFFPKKTLLSKINQHELDYVVFLINNRPRKTLNFMTPYEVFHN